MAEAARRFATALSEHTGLTVDLLDERWTSQEAARSLRDSGVGRKKRRRAALDPAAATLLLDTYLSRSRRAGGAP